jgi:hypothetical protein
MDPLGDPLPTRPIEMGWEFTTELYPSGQFRFIDDPDRQFGNDSVWTRTRTRSDCPEPLLTLLVAQHNAFIQSVSSWSDILIAKSLVLYICYIHTCVKHCKYYSGYANCIKICINTIWSSWIIIDYNEVLHVIKTIDHSNFNYFYLLKVTL